MGFSEKELKVCQVLGAIVFGIGMIMVVTGWFMKESDLGVEEHLTALRGTGYAAMLLSPIWWSLATFKLMVKG